MVEVSTHYDEPLLTRVDDEPLLTHPPRVDVTSLKTEYLKEWDGQFRYNVFVDVDYLNHLVEVVNIPKAQVTVILGERCREVNGPEKDDGGVECCWAYCDRYQS